MLSILFATLAAFALSLATIPWCRDFFHKRGFVDYPDGGRKVHQIAVPRVGGIPIAFSYVAACGSLLILPSSGGQLMNIHFGFIVRLLLPASIVFMVGLVDDLRGLSPWQKLAGQTVAAVLAAVLGVRIQSVAGSEVAGVLSFLLTVLWLLACTNAFNLIDGLDGLAAGVGLFATVTMVLAALVSNNLPLAIATAPLAGALAGFLRYNFNPASIFLGDCGSLLLGFLLGCYGVMWTHKSATLLGMTVPVIAFSLPIIDTCLAIVRRFLRHRPIFGADRGHIHHRLLDFGLSPRRAVLVLYACCAFAATLSLIQARFASHLGGAAVVVFCIAATAGIQRLSFAEFRIFGQMVSRGVFREQINAQVSLLRLAEALEHAEHPEECWPLVRDTCREFGFSDVHLSLGGSTFQDADLAPASQNWSVRIPLSHGSDFVQLQSGFNNNAPETVVSLASFLRRHLGAKVSRVPNELQTLSAGD